jgi:putative NADH-flavin reductase
MKVALFGATGPLGRSLIDRALGAGHTVRALARSPGSIVGAGAGLEVLPGDVLRQPDVEAVVQGCEAVLSALGVRGPPGDTLSEGTRSVIHAMNKLSVRRLVAVSQGGLGANPGLLTELLVRPLRMGAYREALTQEGFIQDSALDWTIIRPFRLTNGPATGRPKVANLLPSPILARTTTRADLAEFMVGQLSDPQYHRQVICLASRGF